MSNIAHRAQSKMANEAEIEPVIEFILGRANEGKLCTPVPGLTEGQVLRLNRLGYLVTKLAPNEHDVDWSERGW